MEWQDTRGSYLLDGVEKYVAQAGQVRSQPLPIPVNWTYLEMKVILHVKKSNDERRKCRPHHHRCWHFNKFKACIHWLLLNAPFVTGACSKDILYPFVRYRRSTVLLHEKSRFGERMTGLAELTLTLGKMCTNTWRARDTRILPKIQLKTVWRSRMNIEYLDSRLIAALQSVKSRLQHTHKNIIRATRLFFWSLETPEVL